MIKKVIIHRRNRADHFSLKKAFKKVTNVVTDAAKLGLKPITQSVASVTGKPIDLKMSTNVGKVVDKVQTTGNNIMRSAVKGFADTVTGGLATKAVNVIRKDENKEKPFAYSEMSKAAALPDTGIKILDKAGEIAPKIGAVAGGVTAGVFAGNKALSTSDKKEGTNLKPSGIEIGPNVLTGQTPIQAQNPGYAEKLKNAKAPKKQLQASIQSPAPLQASFGMPELSPMSIGIIIIVIILLFVASKNKK